MNVTTKSLLSAGVATAVLLLILPGTCARQTAFELGMELQGGRQPSGRPRDHGVLVASVQPEGAAAAADLRPGDVILEVNTQRVATTRELERTIDTLDRGDVMVLLVRRVGATQFAELRIP